MPNNASRFSIRLNIGRSRQTGRHGMKPIVFEPNFAKRSQQVACFQIDHLCLVPGTWFQSIYAHDLRGRWQKRRNSTPSLEGALAAIRAISSERGLDIARRRELTSLRGPVSLQRTGYEQRARLILAVALIGPFGLYRNRANKYSCFQQMNMCLDAKNEGSIVSEF